MSPRQGDDDFLEGRELTATEIGRLFEAVDARPAETAREQGDLLARAAVSGTFTPGELSADLAASPAVDAALAAVLDRSFVVTRGAERRWMLDPSARTAKLAELGERARAVLGSFNPPEDELAGMVARLLQDRPPDAASLETDSLRVLVNAAQWCSPASSVAAQMLPGWRQELERRELIDPLRLLIDGWFVGRQKELKVLRDFVGVVPPTSAFEGWSRWLSRAFRRSKNPPFMVHGVGGIGKSTFMAEFILEHAAVAGERGFPFVYLDFDRALLDPMNVLTLVSDVIRQLVIQFPPLARNLERLQRSLRETAASSRLERLSRSALLESVEQGIESGRIEDVSRVLIESLTKAGLGNRPFLVVLDGFEQVQARGEIAVAQVFEWLESMSRFPVLSAVVSGRVPVESFSLAKSLQLGDLDKSAALELLQQHGLPAPLARSIFNEVGGNPLSLKLAVRVIEAEGAAALDRGPWFLREKLDELQFQGFLYTRLLNHIRDERVRMLAHPGLVLRRLTQPLIRDVLAPLVGIPLASPEDAGALYEGLRREVSLVTQDGDALVHRPDVRAIMLPAQRKKAPERFVQLNRAAADYYRDQPPTDSTQLELAYHRLMLGEDPRAVLADAPLAVVRALGGAVDELPVDAAVALRVVLGLAIGKKAVRALPDHLWEMHAFRKATELLAQQRPEEALEIVEARKVALSSPLLAYPRALASFDTLRWDAANDALRFAATSAVKAGSALPVAWLDEADIRIRPWIERGFLLWYQLRDDEAADSFHQAIRLSEGAANRMLALESLLGGLLTAREASSARFFAELETVEPAAWRKNLATLRRIIFLGFADDRCAAQGVRYLRLRLRSRRQLDRFWRLFGDELDGSVVDRLRDGIIALEPRRSLSADEALSLAGLLSELEDAVSASLARRPVERLAKRIAPFLRTRYAPWRAPLRTALLQCFNSSRSLVSFLAEALPSDPLAKSILRPDIEADEIEDLQRLVEKAIERAEEEDLVVDLLGHAMKWTRATPALSALHRAIRRYTAAHTEDHGPPHAPATPEA